MSEILLYAIIAILALMAIIGVRLAFLLLPKKPRARKPTAPPPAPALAAKVEPKEIAPPSEKGEKKVWTRIAAGALVVPMAGLGLQMGLTGLAAAFLLEGAGVFGTFIAAAAFTVAGVFTAAAILLAKVVIRS